MRILTFTDILETAEDYYHNREVEAKNPRDAAALEAARYMMRVMSS